MAEDDKRKLDIPWATLLPVIAALASRWHTPNGVSSLRLPFRKLNPSTMRYPVQQYQRHSDGWGKARLLTRVQPKPEESDQWIYIGSQESYTAVQFRIMHMLWEQGCTPEAREYYGPRFFSVNRFIGLNMERLTKEWMVIVSDGGKAVATNACVKAVLEAFELEPMPDVEDVSLEKIIARGRQLLKPDLPIS